MSLIVGQQPVVNKSKKSVAGFKIRDGMSIGASVTLRKRSDVHISYKINPYCITSNS